MEKRPSPQPQEQDWGWFPGNPDPTPGGQASASLCLWTPPIHSGVSRRGVSTWPRVLVGLWVAEQGLKAHKEGI